MRAALTLGGVALALCSALAIAQDNPESLLPPGFEKPRSTPAGQPSPGSTPVIQPLPGADSAAGAVQKSANVLPDGRPLPSLRELEAMSPEDLDDLLGLRQTSDMPGGARRSLEAVGVISVREDGMASGSLAGQSAALVRAALAGNDGRLVSRWGHILVRRVLASRLDAPAGMDPADFAALRAGLLVRMGEGVAARALVQDVDVGNYTPALIQTAMDAYAATADITGICPAIAVHGGVRKDADWRVLRAICTAFQGDSAAAMAQLDRMQGGGVWPRVDMLLAQKYAGAAGKARRAVKIEWDGVKQLTPWRYALTLATGLEPPAGLATGGTDRYAYTAALAPMASLPMRATAADRAAAAGILSSAAMVDLYAQIAADGDITGAWRSAAEGLRQAYLGNSSANRVTAMRGLWDAGADATARYSRQVLTAYAAARIPVSSAQADDAPELLTAMLSAGLDGNAIRWADVVDQGSLGWALLATADPTGTLQVSKGAVESFISSDQSDSRRKARFLVSGLAGLGRIDFETAKGMGNDLQIDLSRQTRWTRLIDAAAAAKNPALVTLLAGLGMQGAGWDKMTAVHLYHLVAALNQVGLGAEARMIAAEAVARG